MNFDFINSQPFWALVGVIVGSTLTTLKDVYLDRIKLSRDQRYAALRLVAILEIYAESCLEVAADDGEMVDTGNGWDAREPALGKPKLAQFPDNIEWKSLEVGLTYRTLRFPVRIAESERSINFVFDVIAGPPDYDEGFEERKFRYAELGLDAQTLADEFRKKYKLPPDDAKGRSDALRDIIRDIEGQREKKSAR